MRTLLLFLALSFSTLAACQTTTTDTVYVTDTGIRYHKEGCRYLKYSKRKLSLTVAVKEGYTPCKVCYHATATPSNTQSNGKTTPQKSHSTRCQATTQKGTQCRRSAASGSNYCWQHQ